MGCHESCGCCCLLRETPYCQQRVADDGGDVYGWCIGQHAAVSSCLEEKLIGALTDAGIEFSINGDNNQRATGVLNISFKGLDGEGLLNMLDMHDIYVSIGSACNSKSQDRSHVLKAMGLSDEVIDSSVRISIGRYNTENDIDLLVQQIKKYHSVSVLADT